MKTKAILFSLLLGLTAVFFASCDDDDEGNSTVEVAGISLSESTLEIEAESSATLIATLEPEGATGDIEWSSSAPAVASVTNGVVIGISEGEATIVASSGAFSATCAVTVTAKAIDPSETESLNGTNYTIIQIDETTYNAISSKVINDCRPNDVDKFLYVWDDTFVGSTSSGTNFYGQAESWVSLVVSNVGWSGAGYNISSEADLVDMTDMYTNPEDYVFHIAFKSAQESTSYLLIFADGTSECKICIGPSPFTDNGVTYEPYADFTRDNEWHAIEIPATKLNELGVFYNEPFNDKNIFSFLAGGTAGTTLDFDAAFFYKKAE